MHNMLIRIAVLGGEGGWAGVEPAAGVRKGSHELAMKYAHGSM